MPNDLTQNPIILDTVSGIPLLTRSLLINAIRWVSPSSSAGHQVIIQNQHDRTIWESVAPGSNHVEESGWPEDEPLYADGLQIPTLDSGKIYIYFYNRSSFK